MSTRTAFTVVGTVVGAYFGSAALGATIGSMVGGYIDPVKTKGPRLTDAQQQTSQDGVPIPLTFGVVRIQGNIIASGPVDEHKHSDDGKGSGTENTTYTYTRTYAIGICEGPIAGVRRIWKNGVLVYDARPDTVGLKERLLLSRFLENHILYAGDEGQIPNSQLQAVLDTDSVPAFRGLAYMVGVDEDVTQTAGAIPTYEFEVVSHGTSRTVGEFVPIGYPAVLPFGLSPENRGDPRIVEGKYSYGYRVFDDPPNFQYASLFDAVKAAAAFFGDRPYDGVPVSLGWGQGHSSSLRGWIGGTSLFPWQHRGDHLDQNVPNVTMVIPRAQFSSTAEAQGVGSGGDFWPCVFFEQGHWAARFDNTGPEFPPSPTGTLYSSGVFMYTRDPELIAESDASNVCDGSEPPTMYHFGDYVIAVKPEYSCDAFIDPDWLLVPGTIDLYVDRFGVYHSQGDCEQVSGDFKQLSILVLNAQGTSYITKPVGPTLENGDPAGTETFWTDAYAVASAAGDVPEGWVYGVDYPKGIDKACLCAIGEAVDEEDVSLATIVSTLCIRAGLSALEIDVTELTERVLGFNVATETNAADTINVLAPAFFFDGAEWDGKTWFIKRGHNHVEVLTFDDSVDSDDPRIKETRAQDVELPASITLSYYDPAANLAVTTQRAARRAVTVNATGRDSLQLPVALTSDQAAQVADKLLKDRWAALSGQLEQTIADEFSYLTPTDVVQIQSDGALFRARLGQMTNQEGTLQYEATQDVQSAYQSDVEGMAPPEVNESVDEPPSPTLALYLNLPALRDQDDQPGLYVAATGVTGTWGGALIEFSRDGGLTWVRGITVTQASIVGQLLTDLDVWTPNVPDDEHTVDVRLTSGELASITREQLFMDLNGAVIGEELIQFQTAELIGPAQYRLSGLVRGRKNTAIVSHAIGNNFAMTASLYFLPLQRSDMGRTLTIRAVTSGTANSDGIVQTVTYAPPRSVTEWPVTNVRAIRNGSGDVLLEWTPRARLGNSASPYPSLYFNGYQVTVSNGTISKVYPLTAQSLDYTVAMQTADFGSPVDPLTYSISATNTITGAGPGTGGTV